MEKDDNIQVLDNVISQDTLKWPQEKLKKVLLFYMAIIH